MIGEPQTLDPMASTADLVGTIMQHVYEPLYTFDAQLERRADAGREPAARSPKDGLVYTIPLRKGVKFHNGKEMTSDGRRRLAEALDGDGAARQGASRRRSRASRPRVPTPSSSR